MDVIYTGQAISFKWKICRNASEVPEDFSKADLQVFFIGNDFDGNYDGKYWWQYSSKNDGGYITVTIPADSLSPGTYCCEALWIKNRHQLLDAGSTRTITRARKDRIFKVSDVQEECTDYDSESSSWIDEPHQIIVNSGTTSYGYDGMSAYETAVFNGLYAEDWGDIPHSERAWIAEYQQAEERVNYQMDESHDGSVPGEPQSWANAELKRKQAEGQLGSSDPYYSTSRKKKEEDRQTAESNRASAETSRGTAETQRQKNEGQLGSSDPNYSTSRIKKENDRQTAEVGRVIAENGRVLAENTRVQNEGSGGPSSAGYSTSRIKKELDRQSAESSRATAETSRQEYEGQGDYSDTTEYPNTRRAKEAARQTAETARATAETARQKAEGQLGNTDPDYATSRIKQEIDRQAAEAARELAEAARENAKISSTTIEYAVGDSGTTPPSSGWQSTVPSYTTGDFLWGRTTITFGDGTSKVLYAIGSVPDVAVSQNASTGKTTITVGSDSYDVATDPVSVSQNTETGHTDINIGSDSYPVPSLEDNDRLDWKKIDINSITELFDKSTVILNKAIDNATGNIVDYVGRAISQKIPVTSNTRLYANTYNNRVYAYASDDSYLGLAEGMWGVMLINKSSVYENVAYIRINIYELSDIDSIRVGLQEYENPINGYFNHNSIPRSINTDYVVKQNIKESIDVESLSKSITLPMANMFDLILLNTDYSLSNSPKRLLFITKMPICFFKLYFTEVTRFISNAQFYCEMYDGYVLGKNPAAGGNLLERFTNDWSNTSIDWTKASYSGYFEILVRKQDDSIISNEEIEIIKNVFSVKIDSVRTNIQKIEDWTKGDWTDSSNPTLTKRDYKLRNADWLYLDKGTVINVSAEASVSYYICVWSILSGTMLHGSTTDSGNTNYVLPENAKVLITNVLPTIQNPTISDQVIDVIITTYSPMHAKEPTKLIVCSFNTGDFAGSGFETPSDEGKLAYKEVLAETNADIVGTQEDVAYYNTASSAMTSGENVRTAIYANYKYYYRKRWLLDNNERQAQYNFKAFASKYNIQNVRQVVFLPDAVYSHFYFLCGDLTIEDKKILLVSLHLEWWDNTIRGNQITAMLDYCSKYEYVIIMGDFNPENRVEGEWASSDHYVYATEWKRFTDAGYKLANNGNFGDFDTYIGTAQEPDFPCDNIIVSGNIEIEDVKVITKDWMQDHAPLVAKLSIY